MVGKDDLGTISKLLGAAQTTLLGGVQLPSKTEEDAFKAKVWEVFTDLSHGIWKSCFQGKKDELSTLKRQLEDSHAKVTQLTRDLRLASSSSTDKFESDISVRAVPWTPTTSQRDSRANSRNFETEKAHGLKGSLSDTRLKVELASLTQTNFQLREALDLATRQNKALERQFNLSPVGYKEPESFLSHKMSGFMTPNSDKKTVKPRLASASPEYRSHKPKSARSPASPGLSCESCEVSALRDKLSNERERSLGFYRALKRKESECNECQRSHEGGFLSMLPKLEEENCKLRQMIQVLNLEANRLADKLEAMTTAYATLQREKQVLQLTSQKPKQPPMQEDLFNKSPEAKQKRRRRGGSTEPTELEETDHLKRMVRMLNDDIKDKSLELARQQTTFKSILEAEKKVCRLLIEKAARNWTDLALNLRGKIEDQQLRLLQLESKSPGSKEHDPLRPRRLSAYQLSQFHQSDAEQRIQDLEDKLKQFQEQAEEQNFEVQSKTHELKCLRQANSQLKAMHANVTDSHDKLIQEFTELQRHFKTRQDSANETTGRLELEKQELVLLVKTLSQERGQEEESPHQGVVYRTSLNAEQTSMSGDLRRMSLGSEDFSRTETSKRQGEAQSRESSPGALSQRSEADNLKQLMAKQESIVILIDENNALRNQIQRLLDEAREARTAQANARSEAERRNKSFAEANERLRMLEGDLRSTDSLYRGLSEENETLHDQKGALESTVKEALRKLKDFEGKVGRLEGEKADLQTILRDSQADCEAKVRHLEEALSQSNIEILYKDTEITTLKTHKTQFESKFQELSVRLEELRSKTKLLESELAATKKELARRKTDEAQEKLVSSTTSMLEAELKEQMLKTATLEEDKRSLSERLKEYSLEVEALGDEAGTLRQEVRQLSEAKESCELEIKSLTECQHNLEAQLTRAQAEAKRGLTEASKLKTDYSAARSQISALTEASKSYSAKVQALENTVRLLEQNSGHQGDSEKKLEESLRQLGTHCDKLTKDNKDLEAQLKSVRAEHESWRRANEGRTAEIQQLGDDLKSYSALVKKVAQLMGLAPPTTDPTTHIVLVNDIEAFLKQEAILDRLVSKLSVSRIEEVEEAIDQYIKAQTLRADRENQELCRKQKQLQDKLDRLTKERSAESGKTTELSELQRQVVVAAAKLKRAESRCEELEKQNTVLRSSSQEDTTKQLTNVKRAAADKEKQLGLQIQQLKQSLLEAQKEIKALTDQNSRLEIQLRETHTSIEARRRTEAEDDVVETRPIKKALYDELICAQTTIERLQKLLKKTKVPEGRVEVCRRVSYNGVDWCLLRSADEYYWVTQEEAAKYSLHSQEQDPRTSSDVSQP
jgi:chromosome segregation ATPase